MIPKQEIVTMAAELQLQAHVVEKDYALGWFLAGIAVHPVIGPRWVFKGGTCLKKCYFETYRFSEDLDFTLQDAEHLDEARSCRCCVARACREGLRCLELGAIGVTALPGGVRRQLRARLT